MPWIKQSEKPCDHPGKPSLPATWGNRHMIGDIWQCDICKAQFEVIAGAEGTDMRGEPTGPGDLRWKDYIHRQKGWYLDS